MTSKVYEFLSDSGGNNFTESAPRPPVPGEENELQSNGGMSTQSSGSHKSHVSSKSNKSQSSTKSTKSAVSTKGEISHSPAATPRKSNLEKSSCSSSQKLDNEAMEAPNGYEPEGSAANSPPFTENSTPPHLKWAENLNHLLSDSEGVQLFKDYLVKEGGGAFEVDFWFACQGLKRKSAQSPDISSLVKAIYKHFVRNDGVRCLLKETKQEISDKINKRMAVDQYIYDAAENEVETYMRNVTYPAFLNSDFYVQYVQSYVDSPKSSHSSGSNSARPVSQSGPLPSLPEDKELDTQDVKTNMGPPLFHKVLSHKSYSRSESSGAKRMETISGPSSNKQYPLYSSRHSSYPNHVSYAPASAQDSELQSLSSDALTDDTMSVTDSSIDASHFNLKRHRKAMKTYAQQNRETNLALHSQFIPRTERAPKDRNIAETDPAQFAKRLIERLQQVFEEREAGAKMDEKLRSLSEVEDPASASFIKNTTATSIIPTMMSTSAVLAEEETAESILDQHCSRIWANSNHHTPSRSPGRHSPRNKSPVLSGRLNKTLPASSGHRSRSKRGEKCDIVASGDSGVGEDSCSKETHRHIHHHHHHHHPPRECRNTRQMEYEAQILAYGEYNSSGSRSFSSDFHREVETRGRTSKKGATRKSSDASSHIDSGISMVFDKESLLRIPMAVPGPTSEKVMQWMMDSERVQDASGGYQDSEKGGSSHKTARHRLNQSAGASLPTHKQISKKVGHGTSRSASVERSTLVGPWTPIGQSPQILPNQPFIQDSSMPLPPPPNPTTQLEEARRRLEDQSRTSAMATSGKRTDSSVRSSSAGPVKSKSFAGVPSRDKSKVAVSQNASQMRTMPSAKTVPSGLDVSGGSQTFERPKNYKKPLPTPNMSMNTSTSAAAATETIVGIYFGQEPIPYRHVFPGRCMTLAQFKTLITKKGNFKYYFKRDSDEFGEGAVFEEIGDDNAVLPMWQDKIVAKVEKIDP